MTNFLSYFHPITPADPAPGEADGKRMETMHVTTSLAAICAASPCPEGIRKLLRHVGKTMTEARADTSELPVLTVLESNGLDDALWVMDNAVGNKRICRLFAADCAERAHHLFAAVLPDDDRPMNAILVARDPNATDEQRAAAGAAARAAQKERLRQYLIHGEAASEMPWPETAEVAA